MTESEFADQFGDTPLTRAGLAGMRRNVRAAFASLSSGSAERSASVPAGSD
jgi:hypothetical protein